MTEVLLIDDEDHVRSAYGQALELAGHSVKTLASPERALDLISLQWPGVLATDIRMPGKDGLELMADVLAVDPELPVILFTGHGDVPMAVQAMRDGAHEFLEKPFSADVLVDAVRRALDKRALTIENRSLRLQLSGESPLEQSIVGGSEVMVQLRDQIRSYADTGADVLIHGETGTGKELVARSLHELSDRRDQNFVAINCGALPETIIESELFGHEVGAFTGAQTKRIGKFEHASGGTLFLDEIESMPIDLQVQLLRVLQERKLSRLGSNDEIEIDVRIIAATKSDLRTASDTGSFREDLFYRLNVLTIDIPALRERRDDIPVLFQHFLDQAAIRLRRDRIDLDPVAVSSLMTKDWPGNARELQNAATRHLLNRQLNKETEVEDVETDAGAAPGWLVGQMATFERELISQVLASHGGRMKPTYEQLGVSRKTLYDKMQKHGLAASSQSVEGEAV